MQRNEIKYALRIWLVARVNLKIAPDFTLYEIRGYMFFIYTSFPVTFQYLPGYRGLRKAGRDAHHRERGADAGTGSAQKERRISKNPPGRWPGGFFMYRYFCSLSTTWILPFFHST